MSTGTLTYFGKVLKDILRNNFDTYRNALPDILSQQGWHCTDDVWEMASQINPDYSIKLKPQTADVSIVDKEGRTGMVPEDVLKELDNYFKKLEYEMCNLVIASEAAEEVI